MELQWHQIGFVVYPRRKPAMLFLQFHVPAFAKTSAP